ncbi:DNA repair protein RecO [Ramlibacter sp. H39-3-26]|uniref:DNA repair protein RecO n=1 Tax=Curvibacter soli TaxID=3031331 RepID=UPI0023DCC1E8|nr:DNA repair protein RecO [Ramlibacter sp. H39-3-26]MDF1484366.1 DNA repair protein RecO [Ramlibacter sp. H39-3-26]
MPARRISDEPAYVLHRYDWSESSLILELFTRRHGRVAAVAKGAKRPTSNFRPVLLPLQPLRVAYGVAGENAEIHALKGAEWVGGHVMPAGEALLAGTYLNELLLRLLARDDPHIPLFDAYAGVVRVLAGGGTRGDALESVLRAFELLLLREVGLLPSLDAQTLTQGGLATLGRYVLVPEGGLREAASGERSLAGPQWQALQAALDGSGEAGFSAVLRACAPFVADLKPQLRTLLHYHCGASMLRTRQFMMDIQGLLP